MLNLTTKQIQWIDQAVPPLDSTDTFSALMQMAMMMGGVVATYTSNGTANTADTVAHTLGRVPTGYMVIGQSAAGVVYNGGTAGAFQATATTITLKCNVASDAITLLVF